MLNPKCLIYFKAPNASDLVRMSQGGPLPEGLGGRNSAIHVTISSNVFGIILYYTTKIIREAHSSGHSSCLSSMFVGTVARTSLVNEVGLLNAQTHTRPYLVSIPYQAYMPRPLPRYYFLTRLCFLSSYRHGIILYIYYTFVLETVYNEVPSSTSEYGCMRQGANDQVIEVCTSL